MDLVSILDEHRISYARTGQKCRDGWINIRCPWCDRNPYLGYNIARRYFSCWMCGYKPLAECLSVLTGMSIHECQKLAGLFPRDRLSFASHVGKLKIPAGVGRLLGPHKEYLRSRGFDPKPLEKIWGLQGIGMSGWLKWRIFIPVYQHGKIVTWTSRTITPDKEPRYVSAKHSESSIPIENCLYGADHCRTAAIIVEGPADAWRIGPGAIALCGQQTTPSRLAMLSRYPSRCICFDNEGPATTRSKNLARDLAVFNGVTTIVTLDAKDPASASDKEIELLRKYFLK
jgi:hypothetical protein